MRLRFFAAGLVVIMGFVCYRMLIWSFVGDAYLPANHRDLQQAQSSFFEAKATADGGPGERRK